MLVLVLFFCLYITKVFLTILYFFVLGKGRKNAFVSTIGCDTVWCVQRVCGVLLYGLVYVVYHVLWCDVDLWIGVHSFLLCFFFPVSCLREGWRGGGSMEQLHKNL